MRRIRVRGPPPNKRRRTDGFSRNKARDTVFVFGHRCSAGGRGASRRVRESGILRRAVADGEWTGGDVVCLGPLWYSTVRVV